MRPSGVGGLLPHLTETEAVGRPTPRQGREENGGTVPGFWPGLPEGCAHFWGATTIWWETAVTYLGPLGAIEPTLLLL